MPLLPENLNPEQQAAASHPGGPLLIVAGAGSGKTKTLTTRIVHLMQGGVPPERILAITFTNKAAREMADRVRALLATASLPASGSRPPVSGRQFPAVSQPTPPSITYNLKPSPPLPFLGTFHSWGARVLREEAASLGRTANFSIFDEDDSLRLLKEVIKNLDLDKDQYRPLSFRGRLSAIKNEGRDAAELKNSSDYMEALTGTVFERYESALLCNNAFDFDDLIEKVVRLFDRAPEILKKHQRRYDHILVDEYQDINTVQYQLIKFLAGEHHNLSVVGDDAQSIYGFRFSDFRIFLKFERDWPKATIVKLEENYRSTGNILAAASAIIKNNQLQRPKTLWTKKENGELIPIFGFNDAEDEAYHLVAQILKIFDSPNLEPNIAILYRTNAQSRPIEQALLQNSLPYHIYGGLKFYERMEIKDILAALQLAANPKNTMAQERLAKNFSKKEATLLLVEMPRLAEKLKIVELISFFLENTRYFDYLNANYKNAEERIQNVDELIAFAGTYNHLGLGAFLEQVSLVSSGDIPNGKLPRQGSRAGASRPINLMTVHAAKGLEFNQVFVVGCNEGLMPHECSLFKDAEIEEERRLMYVAVTRARQKLALSFFGTPSRFLYEIPAELTIFKNSSAAPRRRLDSFEEEDDISY